MVRILSSIATFVAISVVLNMVLAIGFSKETTASPNDTVNKTLVWPDGTRYVGEVRNGKRWGKGTIFWNDGTRFVGTFANDLRNGPGTMILPDGSVYNGYFENDALVDTPIAANNNTDESKIVTKIAQVETSVAKVTPKKAMEKISDKSNRENIPPVVAEQAMTPVSVSKDVAINTPSTPLNLDVNELNKVVRTNIESMIDLWAASWSDKNVVQYLAYYSEEFNVPGKQSRRQWEALRRSRLQRPKSINITIDYEKIEITATNSALVVFNQRYESDIFSDRTRKEFALKKEDGFWLITSERSL